MIIDTNDIMEGIFEVVSKKLIGSIGISNYKVIRNDKESRNFILCKKLC